LRPDQCPPADHGFHRAQERLGNLMAMAQAGFLSHADTVDSPDGEGDHARPNEYRQPDAAQNAAASVT
jgi:hypothetical protein